MEETKHIDIQVSETLNSLNGIKRSTPGPYFFTRVQAKLNKVERNIWEALSAFIAQPSVAIAGICLIIFINVVAVVNENEPTTTIADQSEQVYTEEYNLAVNSIYDFENAEP